MLSPEKSFWSSFFKKLADSKGSAFGRPPQRAKYSILIKRPKG
jgi:hypothetical protein